MSFCCRLFFFFFQAEDGIRDRLVTGVQTCALPICDPQSSPKSRSPSRGTPRFSGTPSSEPFLPSGSGQEGRLPCFVWKGFPTFRSHLRMRPVSRRHSRRGLVGGSTFRRTPISRSPLDKNPMPGHFSDLHPVNEFNTKGQFFRASFGKKRQVPKTSRKAASLPGDISRGKRSSMPQPKTRPDSPVPSLQGPCDRSLKSEVPCGSCLNWR